MNRYHQESSIFVWVAPFSILIQRISQQALDNAWIHTSVDNQLTTFGALMYISRPKSKLCACCNLSSCFLARPTSFLDAPNRLYTFRTYMLYIIILYVSCTCIHYLCTLFIQRCFSFSKWLKVHLARRMVSLCASSTSCDCCSNSLFIFSKWLI
jgi:hypothetical protein